MYNRTQCNRLGITKSVGRCCTRRAAVYSLTGIIYSTIVITHSHTRTHTQRIYYVIPCKHTHAYNITQFRIVIIYASSSSSHKWYTTARSRFDYSVHGAHTNIHTPTHEEFSPVTIAAAAARIYSVPDTIIILS